MKAYVAWKPQGAKALDAAALAGVQKDAFADRGAAACSFCSKPGDTRGCHGHSAAWQGPCAFCGKPSLDANLNCLMCHQADIVYCSRECQNKGMPGHALACGLRQKLTSSASAFKEGNYSRALAGYSQVLEETTALSASGGLTGRDRLLQAEAARGVGHAQVKQFMRSEAAESFKKALEIARDLGDELAKAGAYLGLAQIYPASGAGDTRRLEYAEKAQNIANQLMAAVHYKIGSACEVHIKSETARANALMMAANSAVAAAKLGLRNI